MACARWSLLFALSFVRCCWAQDRVAIDQAVVPEAFTMPEASMTIGACGDISGAHRELQIQVSQNKAGWAPVTPLMQATDVTYANLETPVAPGVMKVCPHGVDHLGRGDCHCESVEDPGEVYDGRVYSDYPYFNAHRGLLPMLAASGVDVVSTANNHAMDRCDVGLKRTLDSLDQAGLAHTGTRRSDDEDWHTLTHSNGITVAWLACTKTEPGCGLNQTKDIRNDPHVLVCNKTAIELVRNLSNRESIDSVIVTPHWGYEYKNRLQPAEEFRRLAHSFLEAGATAIVGNHIHMLQPMERYVTQDGRRTVVFYGLGNFWSHQGYHTLQDVTARRLLWLRSSAFAMLSLRKTSDGNTQLDEVHYVPLYTTRTTSAKFAKETGSCGEHCKCPTFPYKKHSFVAPELQMCRKYKTRIANDTSDTSRNSMHNARRLLGTSGYFTYSSALDWLRQQKLQNAVEVADW